MRRTPATTLYRQPQCEARNGDLRCARPLHDDLPHRAEPTETQVVSWR